MINYKRISKLLSLILRHRPDEFGLQVDEFGFVPLDEAVAAVQSRYDAVQESDIRSLVEDARQRRFEISDRGIRALYGHSFFVEMDGEPMQAPERFFMGSTRREAERFMKEGLKPVDRNYVHLSLTREAASRRSREEGDPLVLEILAQQAQEQGVEFYSRGEVVLTRDIPADCLAGFSTVEASAAKRFPAAETGTRAAEQASSKPAVVSYGRRPRKDTRRLK